MLAARCLTSLVLLFSLGMHSVVAKELSAEQREAVVKWLAQGADDRPAADTLPLPDKLSAQDAAASLATIWDLYREATKDPELADLPPRLTELIEDAEGGRVPLQAGRLTLGEMTMPYVVVRRETKAPAPSGRALFICTHGGGGNGEVSGPHAWPVNTREWQTQVQLAAQLYPPEGIYFVPRMADDRMGRWFHRHNQVAFERVIEHAIAHWGVDPNRVYRLGISQGGFGTNKLVTFMPDRFAGANPMAGGVNPDHHPPANLRNVAFRNDVGEKDTMFNRVGNAIKFHERLDALHAEDPQGYMHMINVQQGRGHGIDYRPGVAWIAKHTRSPWPDKLVWINRELDGKRRARHYWVELVGKVEAEKTIIRVRADRDTNTITLTAQQQAGTPQVKNTPSPEPAALSGVSLRLLLHDDLLDLDQPVKVMINGEIVHDGPVKRSAVAQLRTLAGYGDPTMTASAELVFAFDE